MSTLTITQPAANVLEISNEQPAFAGLAYEQSFLTVDVAMTTASQVYTLTSVTLPAGTWYVAGQAVIMQGATSGSPAMTMFLLNVTTGVAISSSSAHKSAASSTSQGLNCSAVIVLTASTMITMKAVSTIGSFTARYQSTTGNYDNATGITAIRISA